MPLMFLPLVFSAMSDALVALGRIGKFLVAEELAEPYAIDYTNQNALDVDGDFTWETVGKGIVDPKFSIAKDGAHGGDKKKEKKPKESKPVEKKKKGFFGGKKAADKGPVLPTTVTDDQTQGADGAQAAEGADDEKPFELKNLKMHIPKGSFIAIVGRVGSGKVITLDFDLIQLALNAAFIEFSSAGLDRRDAQNKGRSS
jgi:ATP-binding cassette, subfamily C (CFTR/MRP), member 1